MNSRDLCLVEQLPELIAAGIDSFKVEGRMKSLYYVATTARVYRDAIDRLVRDPRDIDPRWRSELEKVSHRPYDTGFLFGHEDARSMPPIPITSVPMTLSVLSARMNRDSGWKGAIAFYRGMNWSCSVRRCVSRASAPNSSAGRDGAVVPAGQPNSQLLLELPSWAEPGDLIRRQRPE